MYSSNSPPHRVEYPIGSLSLLVHRRARLGDRAREVTPLDGILNADVARIVLAVDECRAVRYLHVGDFAQRNLLSVRRGEQDVADLLRRRAILRLKPDDEIERSFALHDLRRGLRHRPRPR